jgi:hypothetical protein
MSRQLHRFYRRVLRIERFLKQEGRLQVPVTLVTWAVVRRENSKSIFTTHLGITVYVAGSRCHSGVAAHVTTKEFRIPKSLDCEVYADLRERRLSEAYGHALYSYLGEGEEERVGQVSWYDESRGLGMLEIRELGMFLPFWACNFVGADSGHPERVTNVKVERGASLYFVIHRDPYVTKQCGAVRLRAAA